MLCACAKSMANGHDVMMNVADTSWHEQPLPDRDRCIPSLYYDITIAMKYELAEYHHHVFLLHRDFYQLHQNLNTCMSSYIHDVLY